MIAYRRLGIEVHVRDDASAEEIRLAVLFGHSMFRLQLQLILVTVAVIILTVAVVIGG